MDGILIELLETKKTESLELCCDLSLGDIGCALVAFLDGLELVDLKGQ